MKRPPCGLVGQQRRSGPAGLRRESDSGLAPADDPQVGSRLGCVAERSVLLGAGGIASTVLAHWLVRRQAAPVTVLSCDLGQQVRGVLAAAATAAQLQIEHRAVDLSGFARALTEVRPDTASTAAGGRTALQTADAVPIMLELGLATAAHRDATVVLIGRQANDALVDPAVQRRDTVRAPLGGLTAAEVVRLGADLRVPFGQTRSCHHDLADHCGRCAGCRRRREAFTTADVPDPTTYRHRASGQ